MALFPESSGFVKLCQTSVAIMPDDNITHHQLLELVIHVNGKILSNKQKEAAFCGLLSGMLKDVPTEEAPMRVMWAKVLRMLDAYKNQLTLHRKRESSTVVGLHKATPTFVRNLKLTSKSTLLRYLIVSNEFPL